MSRSSNQTKKIMGLLATGLLSIVAQPVWSSGFALNEQNASSLGTAYAGAGSMATDASIGFYNSAGLTRLPAEQIAASAVWISPNSKLHAGSATATFPTVVAGRPVLSNSFGHTKSRTDAIVPGLHYAKKLCDGLYFGFNAVSAFGLKTKYPDNSVARYTATRSELRTFDLSPSLAYSFGNGLSIGAGLDAVYLIAKLDTRLGFGTAAFDGLLENTADNWGYGWHAGILYEFSDCTRIGLSYRSYVKVKPKGESVIQFLAARIPETRLGVRSSLKLPESALLSIYHDFNDQWAGMLDVQWTHWKRFNTLTLRYFDEGSQLTFVQNFKDTMRVSAGVSFKWDECIKLKVGTAWDRTPTRDQWRSIRIPDQDRCWVAIGAQYRFSKCLALDVAYAHLFFKKANINEAAPFTVPGSINRTRGRQTFTGTSKGRADLIGIQLTWDLV